MNKDQKIYYFYKYLESVGLKKLVLVLAIFFLIILAIDKTILAIKYKTQILNINFCSILKNIKVFSPLKYILYINYVIYFKKDQIKILMLLNFASKINIICLAYTVKLSVKVLFINVKACKINDFISKIFYIVLAIF